MHQYNKNGTIKSNTGIITYSGYISPDHIIALMDAFGINMSNLYDSAMSARFNNCLNNRGTITGRMRSTGYTIKDLPKSQDMFRWPHPLAKAKFTPPETQSVDLRDPSEKAEMNTSFRDLWEFMTGDLQNKVISRELDQFIIKQEDVVIIVSKGDSSRNTGVYIENMPYSDLVDACAYELKVFKLKTIFNNILEELRKEEDLLQLVTKGESFPESNTADRRAEAERRLKLVITKEERKLFDVNYGQRGYWRV